MKTSIMQGRQFSYSMDMNKSRFFVINHFIFSIDAFLIHFFCQMNIRIIKFDTRLEDEIVV